MEQKINQIVWIWRVFYLIVAVLIVAFGITFFEGATIIGVLIVWSVLAVAAYVAVYLFWYRELAQKINALAPIMQCAPERYIRELNELVQGKRAEKAFHNIKFMNLGAAYSYQKDYQAAMNCFLQVKPERLNFNYNRAVYWEDLAMAEFYLGKYDAACAILAQQAALFQQMEKDERLGGMLAVLRIFEQIAADERDEARVLLAEARRRWPSPEFQDDFDYLDVKINEK